MAMLGLKTALKNSFDRNRWDYNIDLKKGVMGSLLNDFYKKGRHPETFPNQRNKTMPYRRSIRALLKALEWPRTIDAIDDYPMDASPGSGKESWSHHCQGTANDGKNWFITSEWNLWKIPAEHPLAETEGSPFATFPDYLSAKGYYHMGDLDYQSGHLYVPVEGHRYEGVWPFRTEIGIVGRIALFDPKPPVPVYIHSAELFNSERPHPDLSEEDKIETQTSVPWCAINPLNRLLFTSNFNADSLYVYEQAVVGSSTKGIFMLELTYKGKFALKDSNGNSKSIYGIQGGVFSKNGHLYLVSDNEVDLSNSGIFGFDMITGRNVCRTRVNFNPSYPADEELEGIDIWDLDAPGAPHVPSIKGQIHVIMVDVDIPTDDVYFKHYRVAAGDEDKI